VLSKTAAIKGAVVVCMTTPPSKRTGSDAAVKVTTIQKKIRPRSRPGGGGTETARSPSAPTTITTPTFSRRSRGIGVSTRGE